MIAGNAGAEAGSHPDSIGQAPVRQQAGTCILSRSSQGTPLCSCTDIHEPVRNSVCEA